jgi:hypothetical protein
MEQQKGLSSDFSLFCIITENVINHYKSFNKKESNIHLIEASLHIQVCFLMPLTVATFIKDLDDDIVLIVW